MVGFEPGSVNSHCNHLVENLSQTRREEAADTLGILRSDVLSYKQINLTGVSVKCNQKVSSVKSH